MRFFSFFFYKYAVARHRPAQFAFTSGRSTRRRRDYEHRRDHERICRVCIDGGGVVVVVGGRTAERGDPDGRAVPVQQRAVRRRVHAGRRRRVQGGGGRGWQQTGLVQLRGPRRPEAHRHLHGRQGRLQGHRRPLAGGPDAGPRSRRAGAQVDAATRPVVSTSGGPEPTTVEPAMERGAGRAERRGRTVESMELGRSRVPVRRRPVGPMELRVVRRPGQMGPASAERGAGDRGAQTRAMEPVELHTDHGQVEPVELGADRAAAVVQRQPRFRQIQPEQISGRVQLHVQSKLMRVRLA